MTLLLLLLIVVVVVQAGVSAASLTRSVSVRDAIVEIAPGSASGVRAGSPANVSRAGTPTGDAAASAPHTPKSGPVPFSQLRIAFVDDEKPNCRLGVRMLGRLGVPTANIIVLTDGTQ